MKLPHPIPYQGSKRNLADKILRFFPDKVTRLIEPFAGSAAITIATASEGKAAKFFINDINAPLMALWDMIINRPGEISEAYSDMWNGQLGDEDNYYYYIRDLFNKSKSPEYLLFLLAKCVKAAVRYNSNGDFNQSTDKRRLGRNPEMMTDDIYRVSKLLKGRTKVESLDYSTVFKQAKPTDLLYLDPPYQGTGLNGGFNYAANIEFDFFVNALHDLNQRDIPFILSYDGRTGDKIHGISLPRKLGLTKIEVNAGRSSQATLLNRNEITYESIYLSKGLCRLINPKHILENQSSNNLILQG